MSIGFNLSRDEWKRFGTLAIGFLCVIGSYWMLRILKNGLFMDMVGHRSLPWVKVLSMVALLGVLVIYNRLVDRLGRRRLIHWLYGFYVAIFVLLAFAMTNPTIGLDNQTGSTILGWVLYIVFESYGSLGPLLLWSYVVSISTDEQAQRGFPFLAGAGNLGALLFSSYVSLNVEEVGVVVILLIAAGLAATVPVVIEIFIRVFGGSLGGERVPLTTAEVHAVKAPGGVWEGLVLIARRPYVAAILMIVVSYEMTGSFFDYLMNAAAQETLGDRERVISFLALYAVSQSTLSFAFAALGTTTLLRYFGLTACLVIFPLTLGGLNAYIQIIPGLWSFFIAQAMLKGLSYSLDKPCREILYVPTSRAIQFKAKSWIDTAGSRFGKALGKMVIPLFPYEQLLYAGGAVFFGVIAAWVPVAVWAGRKNRRLVAAGEVIH